MSSFDKSAKKLLAFLDTHGKRLSPMLIMTHDHPDPDAISSAFALQHLLNIRYGIQSKIVYGGIIARMENRMMVRILRIPLHALRPSHLKHYRHIALVDTQPGFRNNAFPSQRRATIVIDQHSPLRMASADCTILDTNCGATCVLLAKALLLAEIPIPTAIATALAYGIITDTQSFFRSRNTDVIRVFMQIYPQSDLQALAKIQNPERNKEYFTAMSRGIQKAFMRRKAMVTHLGSIRDPDLVPQVADLLLTYKGIVWALCTGRYRGRLRVSLRTTSKHLMAADVLRDIVERKQDAGGHETIAGGSFRLKGDQSEAAWENAERDLALRFFQRLRIRTVGDFHRPFHE